MRRSATAVRVGDRLEFWARAKPGAATDTPIAIRAGGKTFFRLAYPTPYFQFYTYTHYREGEIEIEWEDAAIEISVAYLFNPATVAQTGVTFVEFRNGDIRTYPRDRWPGWYAAERGRPQLRFSPFRGWMNDPNGLCYVDGLYHLFYQFHLNSTDWGPMHWGHAASPDLYHWTHLPVFLHPEENLEALGATGGAFSGTTCIGPGGKPLVYYTERMPTYEGNSDFKELQRRVVPSRGLLRPNDNEVVLDHEPEGSAHDFRDPKVWYDTERGVYRMVLGAAIEDDPAVLLYGSEDGIDWTFVCVLYRAPAQYRENGARCVECPDFFPLDGHFVLVMSFVGLVDPDTGRHNLMYALTGSFENDRFQPHGNELQELDFGTDFYAMQSFAAQGRQIAFAWLFNWQFRKPPGSVYSGEMSLPRVLALDARQRLVMRPEEGYRALRSEPLAEAEPGRLATVAGAAAEIALAGRLDGIRIFGRTADGHAFAVEHIDGRLKISVPEDDGRIRYASAPLDLSELTLIFDRGTIELFANGGAVCGTRRTYRVIDLDVIEIVPGPATEIMAREAWSLRSVWG
nr:glycoside hydrolase family 32 protein [Prosthecomicrobium pneumaticum]